MDTQVGIEIKAHYLISRVCHYSSLARNISETVRTPLFISIAIIYVHWLATGNLISVFIDQLYGFGLFTRSVL